MNGKIPFLDVNIFNIGHELKFSVYRKFADYSPYMHFFSYTATNIKTGLVLSLFLRALRVCSNEYLSYEINLVKPNLIAGGNVNRLNNINKPKSEIFL